MTPGPTDLELEKLTAAALNIALVFAVVGLGLVVLLWCGTDTKGRPPTFRPVPPSVPVVRFPKGRPPFMQPTPTTKV